MSSLSPSSVLYSSDGYELATVNGSAIPAGNRGILVEGSDGTNSRFLSVDASGRAVVVGAGVAGTPAGGVVSIQGVASGTVVPVSGTITANIGTTNGLALDTSVNGIIVSQGSTTSGEKGVLTQGAVTTAAPTYTTAQTSPLSLTTAGSLRVDGSGTTQPVSGTITANAGTGNFTVVQSTASSLNATIVGTTAAGSGASSGLVTIQGNASGTPVPVSGTVTATNASVSATGSTPPASATYAGASVTTAAPTYTTGQMSALSLTTSGSLRVDGSGSTQPVSGTVTANIGTTNGLTLDATITGGTQRTKITDGTNNAAVKAASTAPVAADPALVVAISPNSTLSVISDKSTTGTITSVANAITSTTLLASNSARISATFYNDSVSKIYLAMAATASTTSFSVLILPNSYFELPISYTGIVTFISALAVGSIRITEFS